MVSSNGGLVPLGKPPSQQEVIDELFGGRNPYPAEDVFNPPHSSDELAKTMCTAAYGLLVGYSYVKLYCHLGIHKAPEFHAAPLADGIFRWPFDAEGAEEQK